VLDTAKTIQKMLDKYSQWAGKPISYNKNGNQSGWMALGGSGRDSFTGPFASIKEMVKFFHFLAFFGQKFFLNIW